MLLLSTSLLYHVFKSDAVSLVLVPLLLLDNFSLCALRIETTSAESFCVTSIVGEHRTVIQVTKAWKFSNYCLTILLNLVNDTIALKIENLKVGHVTEDLIKDFWVINLVILQIASRDAWALKESSEVIQTIASNTVPCQVKHV